MNVLFVASECAPIVKVGGLGDVIGSLPKALKEIGVNVAVCLPAYKPAIDTQQNLFNNRVLNTEVRYNNQGEPVNLFKSFLPNTKVPLYLIQNDKYISSGGIYGDPTAFASSQTEIERFAFFSKAVSQIFTSEPECDFKVDIIHCHDWHTGIIPQLTKKNFPSVFTVHNLANQGFSATDIIYRLGLDLEKNKLLKWDSLDTNIDFILQGIMSADYITTVSPTYAKEIQTSSFGEGINEVLSAREGRIYGILNGIDYEVWNPKTDRYIKENYDCNSLEKKEICKIDLQNALNLPVDKSKPILSFVARLTTQKGIDMIISLMDEILELNCQLVVLGMGDPSLENRLRIKSIDLEKEGLFESRIKLEFNEDLAHKIYAGSDILLMPSRFEPCGLTQMIAMRYGTIPLVRRVGGLSDTVESGITGFTFDNYNDNEFLDSLKRALNYFGYKEEWKKIMTNATKKDFSWKESAKKYGDIYLLASGT